MSRKETRNQEEIVYMGAEVPFRHQMDIEEFFNLLNRYNVKKLRVVSGGKANIVGYRAEGFQPFGFYSDAESWTITDYPGYLDTGEEYFRMIDNQDLKVKDYSYFAMLCDIPGGVELRIQFSGNASDIPKGIKDQLNKLGVNYKFEFHGKRVGRKGEEERSNQ